MREEVRTAQPLFSPYRDSEDAYSIPKNPVAPSSTCPHGLPIPPRALFLGYEESDELYLAGGRRDTETMLRLIETSGLVLGPGSRVLDLGCGAGRMLRHLVAHAATNEVWGIDTSSDCIFWCKRNLSPPFLFATGTVVPQLPFEDGYFRLAYCGSVFTHIDDLAEAWLLELRRVLARDGRLYLTIHDEHTVDFLDGAYNQYPLAAQMRREEIWATQRRNAAMLVVGRGQCAQVFYDGAYFRKIVEPILRVLSVTPEAYGYQTALVLGKK